MNNETITALEQTSKPADGESVLNDGLGFNFDDKPALFTLKYINIGIR